MQREKSTQGCPHGTGVDQINAQRPSAHEAASFPQQGRARIPHSADRAGLRSKYPATSNGKVKDGVTNARDSDGPGPPVFQATIPHARGSPASGKTVSEPRTRNRQRRAGREARFATGSSQG